MNTSTTSEPRKPLRTSDLAAAGTTPAPTARDESRAVTDRSTPSSEARSASEARPATRASARTQGAAEPEQLAELFPADVAARFRTRWAEVQSGFVDDPRGAVANGDELVAEVMKDLAESFSHERERLENELTRTSEASTETLRLGLRRYRSFFERLLSI
jgi:hypothetical protein